jgi:hypothetical protein
MESPPWTSAGSRITAASREQSGYHHPTAFDPVISGWMTPEHEFVE